MKNQYKILIAATVILVLAVTYMAGKDTARPVDQTPVTTVGDGTSTPEVTGPIDPKEVDWTLFTNEKGTLRFNRPAEWTLIKMTTKSEAYELNSPEYKPMLSGTTALSEVYITAHENPSKLSVRQYFANFDDVSRLWFEKLAYDEVDIGGREAFVFPDTDFVAKSDKNTVYIVDCPKRIVTLSFNHETDRDAAVVEAMAYSIACE